MGYAYPLAFHIESLPDYYKFCRKTDLLNLKNSPGHFHGSSGTGSWSLGHNMTDKAHYRQTFWKFEDINK